MPLAKTNMTEDEMVPNTCTEGHDPRYWCLPPMRDDPDDVVETSGGYEFHLVTVGHKVGAWRNWTVAKAMLTGYPDSTHKGHRSYEGCRIEWQEHCKLGLHPHPPDPQLAVRSKAKNKTSTPTAAAAGTSKVKGRRRSSSTPVPKGPVVSVAPPLVGSDPEEVLRDLGRRGRVFHVMAFDNAMDEETEPELLSTPDFQIALAYAEGNA
ncbi:hypothetical protein FB451DRAFT_1412198 [Mycena latifolia]|nr:hypothetical protein FB451DRAFT_1412198 [Mycena latifolia]